MTVEEKSTARPWRIEYGGGYYHVLSAGNEGLDIFYNDKDRRFSLDAFGGDDYWRAIGHEMKSDRYYRNRYALTNSQIKMWPPFHTDIQPDLRFGEILGKLPGRGKGKI
jgi:hypothetical protein